GLLGCRTAMLCAHDPARGLAEAHSIPVLVTVAIRGVVGLGDVRGDVPDYDRRCAGTQIPR
ncbi:MAG: hypothetical protein E7K76_10835, partial [Cutibacterium avidum]|nr:hypothetical protein [Cutibacterium avidum]